jgi:hypothetical protein
MGRSAYGHIKAAEVMNWLPVDELEELERLLARRKLSPVSHARLNTLWDRAFDLHSVRMEARKREVAAREERIRFYEQQGR